VLKSKTASVSHREQQSSEPVSNAVSEDCQNSIGGNVVQMMELTFLKGLRGIRINRLQVRAVENVLTAGLFLNLV
jgi:hypothetical protein